MSGSVPSPDMAAQESRTKPDVLARAGAPTPASPADDAVSSEALLRGCKELRILHQGEVYRLQLTRQGKLILTK